MTLDPKTNKVKIRPCEKDCRLIINGTAVTAQTELVIVVFLKYLLLLLLVLLMMIMLLYTLRERLQTDYQWNGSYCTD